jgi:23S rRNA (uracil1939-C5)-methyltransferase
MSPRRTDKRRRPLTPPLTDHDDDRPVAGGDRGTRFNGGAPDVSGRSRAAEISVVCEVEVRSIAAGGDGVGRVDGRVIFVPRAAPGDLARIRATTVQGGRFARGALLELLRPSLERVTPECVHYVRDQCGGCQLQHLRYESQLAAKGAIVRDALVRIAHRAVTEVAVEPSPRQWRYRRKLTLTLRRGVGAGRGWIAGLRRLDAPDSIFALEDCPITEEGVVGVWRAIMRVAQFLPDAPSLRGAVGTTARGHAFHLEGGARWDHCRELQAAVPALSEIWWTPERGTRRRMGPAAEGEAARVADRSGASFTQINSDVGAALHADVMDRTMSHDPHTVIDAYAGRGATAVALANRGVSVVAIEVDREASSECAAALPAGSRAMAARVEDVFASALPADVVVLNPPRTGVAAAVTAALRAATPRPRAVVYVSCDPATLARDVDRLPGWRVTALRAFDMFPQTAHVETVCELVPDRAAR